MNLIKGLSGAGLAAVLGLSTISGVVHAQYGAMPEGNQQPATDGDVARVKQALHSDPALNDKHIDVSVEKGKVVLRGFVSTAQELQKAVRAANEAAGKRQVVNNLTIKEGGDGGSG